MTERDTIICADTEELSRKAAERFIRLANDAIVRSGRFIVALSGGSTPRALYSLLASPDYNERIPWNKVHLYWGDERCVPPHHPDSNFLMVQETLLANITIPRENFHRIAAELDPKVAAADYEEQVRKLFELTPGALPRFDLILLGLGEDGHTASLFPENEALNEAHHLVVATYVEKLNAHRVTLTLPVINRAAEIVFLVAGQDKSAVIKLILGELPEGINLPAARIRPANGRLVWLVTKDAASELLQ
ncbi:MAG: 6-phosphogluconolactonase [Deltaproteobacteria bacterium]|nr:6-phosphogluconolactonase [Deltaproteobacteria bacterium]